MTTTMIQWFPGHMNKARNEIKEMMPQMDVIIEVLDARIPYSSDNPMIGKLRGDKPVIKILNKADLADPVLTQAWMDFFESESGVKTLAFDNHKSGDIHKIISLCQSMVAGKAAAGRQIKAMIMGIPNVGKSTLINTLAGRTVAKTGNEPAVTKSQQLIKLDAGIMLYDTPGMLWPKVENAHSGYRLAATGGVKDTAFDFSDVASYTAEYLLSAYPELLKARYKLEELPASDWEFFDLAGRSRGLLKKGGVVDTYRMSEILVNELRAGQIGNITLETPAMRAAEEIEVAQLRVAAEEKRQAKEEEKRLRRLKTKKNRK